MILNLGVVLDAVLLVVAVLWLREMSGRWRGDLDEFRRATAPADRAVIVVIWAVTAVILLLAVDFALGILAAVGVL